jgi:hypothetical protein
MKKIISVFLVLFYTQILALADEAAIKKEDNIVKKSSSGICHDKNSKFYVQTKKFKSFKTMKECLDSGGRLPKK